MAERICEGIYFIVFGSKNNTDTSCGQQRAYFLFLWTDDVTFCVDVARPAANTRLVR